MNRGYLFFLIMAFPAMILAQSETSQEQRSKANPAPYQPAVPAPSVNMYGGGGWPGYSSGALTAAGSAMSGMASVISAKGDYNLSTSAAAINMTQAQKNEIENRQQWTNTYFDMRETNRKAHAAERRPPPTMEQIARMAREGVPKKLQPSQIDAVSGGLNWPSALQDPAFESQRSEVDQLFAARARYGGLSYADQTKVREAVDTMFDALKAQVREMPPPDYVACRTFLQSVTYAATKTELD